MEAAILTLPPCILSFSNRTVSWDKLRTRETSTSFTSIAKLPPPTTKVSLGGLIDHCSPSYRQPVLFVDPLLPSSHTYYFYLNFLEQFGMTGPESFLLTNRSGCLSVDGIDDVHDFNETLVWPRVSASPGWDLTCRPFSNKYPTPCRLIASYARDWTYPAGAGRDLSHVGHHPLAWKRAVCGERRGLCPDQRQRG